LPRIATPGPEERRKYRHLQGKRSMFRYSTGGGEHHDYRGKKKGISYSVRVFLGTYSRKNDGNLKADLRKERNKKFPPSRIKGKPITSRTWKKRRVN